tara:strand:- start:48 stop:302 length:255 start_codon:yes stop_codon:yes gene_type:complete
MKSTEILKKQIIYRSLHRGSKEMDLLLGGFVKKYIDNFNDKELKDLLNLLFISDEDISSWYFKKNNKANVPVSSVTMLLKNYKI